MSKQQSSKQSSNTEALAATVNTLLAQIKQQGKLTNLPEQQSWVYRHLSPPKSLDAVIWRLCWLLVIPAIATFLFDPLVQWLWMNGYPLIVLLTLGSAFIIYPLVYQFAWNSVTDRGFQRLISVQFAIPPATVFFINVWELLSNG